MSQLKLKLTHPEKVLIPDAKITKQKLADYYVEMSEWILPHVRNRPLSLLRCPEGMSGECFFQKNMTAYRPDGIEEASFRSPKGTTDRFVYLASVKGLVALVQMNVLEIHTWGTHRDHPLKPDLVVFDIDPGPGVPWKAVCESAFAIRATLKDLGLRSYVKVSGGKGFHIHVPVAPVYTWNQIKNFAKTVADHLVSESPGRYVSTVTKAKRQGRIFIDYLRNGYGATSVAPYSLRARKGGCVALPIDWDEVMEIQSCEFRLPAALKRLRSQKKDPWAGYFRSAPRIEILDRTGYDKKNQERNDERSAPSGHL